MRLGRNSEWAFIIQTEGLSDHFPPCTIVSPAAPHRVDRDSGRCFDHGHWSVALCEYLAWVMAWLLGPQWSVLRASADGQCPGRRTRESGRRIASRGQPRGFGLVRVHRSVGRSKNGPFPDCLHFYTSGACQSVRPRVRPGGDIPFETPSRSSQPIARPQTRGDRTTTARGGH